MLELLSTFRHFRSLPGRNGTFNPGTSFAWRKLVSTLRYQSLRADEVLKRTSGWVRQRPWLYIPLYAAIVLLLALAGYPSERLLPIGGLCAGVSIWWLIDARRKRRDAPNPHEIFRASLLSSVLFAVICLLTGGTESPLLPLLLGPSLGTVLLYGRSRRSHFSMAALIAPLLLLLLFQGLADSAPPIASPWQGLLAVLSVLYTGFFLRTSAMLVSDVYTDAGRTLDSLREELLVNSTRRTRDIEAMGAKVAHELKNPLAAVKGLVQLLCKTATEPRTREHLGVAKSELDRMEGIIEGYLSFTRPIEALRHSELSLGALVDEVFGMLDSRAREAALSLTRRGDVLVQGDSQRLKEALLNLTTNGIEATGPGGRVEVQIDSDGETASVRVSDTGAGLSPEDLARLGTPFFTRRANGTGLGVVLARAAVLQHGGDIAFESERGRGTVVTLTLPRTPTSREALLGQDSAHR